MNKLLARLNSLSIYTKFTVLIFGLIFVFSTVVILLAVNTTKEQTNLVINEMIESNIDSNRDFIASAILANDNWSLYKFVKSLVHNKSINNAAITDTNKIVLADTDTQAHRIGTRLTPKSSQSVFPFGKDGVPLGYFILDIERSTIKNILEKNFSTDLVLLLLAGALSFLISAYLLKHLLNRLNILRDNAKAIAEKRWEGIREIHSLGSDEITDLVASTTEIMKEIKRSVKNEEKLKNFYHQILSSVDILILICDRNGKIIYQNAHKLSRYLEGEDNFIAARIAHIIACHTQGTCAFSKQKISGTTEEDISLYYQVSVVDEYFVISFSDITQLAKLEENEKVLYSLTSLGEISSQFAHEIKNLLQPLKLLLREGETLDREDLQIINNTLNRMDAQVLDFLSLGRPLDAHDIEWIDAKNSFGELLAMFKPKLEEKRISVQYSIEENLRLRMSKKSYEMIFMNLMNNSIEAIGSDGEIDVRWTRYKGNSSRLFFQDTGAGIPETARNRLFKPFFSTKPNGSGLGLFTIYKIVYQSGGEIRLSESEKTTFIITLPTGEESC